MYSNIYPSSPIIQNFILNPNIPHSSALSNNPSFLSTCPPPNLTISQPSAFSLPSTGLLPSFASSNSVSNNSFLSQSLSVGATPSFEPQTLVCDASALLSTSYLSSARFPPSNSISPSHYSPSFGLTFSMAVPSCSALLPPVAVSSVAPDIPSPSTANVLSFHQLAPNNSVGPNVEGSVVRQPERVGGSFFNCASDPVNNSSELERKTSFRIGYFVPASVVEGDLFGYCAF